LIFDGGMRAFPPRLPAQPIFYPVLNREYAEQIAREWNTKEDDAAGYVTCFEVPDAFADRYERRVVGGSEHEEWWVPAEELDEFNRAIEGYIRVERAFFGSSFRGFSGTTAGLAGKDARAQLVALARHLAYSTFDVWCETYVNRKAVFLHYPFWATADPEEVGITRNEKEKFLDSVRYRWGESDIPFGLPSV
jgi:hypothetical protein